MSLNLNGKLFMIILKNAVIDCIIYVMNDLIEEAVLSTILKRV